MNASTNNAFAEVNSNRILAAASASGRPAVLGAVAIMTIWVLVLAAVLFGVLAPLNQSFACVSESRAEIASHGATATSCDYQKV